MKIAFILRKFPVLSETFILNQIIGLIDRGHTVEIYSIYQGDLENIHQEFCKYNLLEKTYYPPTVPQRPIFRIIKALYLLGSNFNQIFRLSRALNIFKYGRQAASLYLFYMSLLIKKTKEYDIIHCHFGLMGLIGIDLRDLGLLKGKVVTSFHGFDVNVYPKLHGQKVYRRLIEQGNLYTVNSDFTAQALSKLGFTKDKTIKLPVGVDLKYFDNSHRREYEDNHIYLLTVARLIEVKGVEYSVRAVAKAIDKFPNLTYKIVGEGPLKDKISHLIKELRVEKNINLLGGKRRDEIYQLYKESHIFILSGIVAADNSQEAQGLVLQEAQAAGLPIITTRVGGIPEGVLENQSAFIVPERDVEAITQKIIFLLENPEIRKSMEHLGCDFVAKNYSLDYLNDYLVEIYYSLQEKS